MNISIKPLTFAATIALAAGCTEPTVSSSKEVTVSPAPQVTAMADGPAFVMAERGSDGAVSITASGGSRPEGVYQAGSIAKYACTLGAFSLARDGRLDLDATITEALPGYAGSAGDQVTVRHLLQNRAGLPDELIPALQSDPTLPGTSIPSLEAANRFAAGEASQAPGEAFDYVNSNWVLIQAILEAADGRPLATLLAERVFAPAGLEHTSVFVGAVDSPDAVIAASPGLPIPDFVSCAGGLASTPADLIGLLRYPYQSGDFSAAELEALTAVATPEEGYALGGRVLDVEVDGTVRTLSWQSGTNGAYRSLAAYDPVADEGFAIMTASEPAGVLSEQRAAWLDAGGRIPVEE